MKRIISISLLFLVTLVALIIFSALSTAGASTPDTARMGTANQFYESGEFRQAAEAYEQIVDQGVQDSILYYNLGNSYFKLEDYGRAILSYRRAQVLAPRDGDIHANLDLARAQALDQLDIPRNEIFSSQMAHFTQQWFTLNEFALFALGLWLTFAALLVAYSTSETSSRLREGLQYALIVAVILVLFGSISLGSRLYLEKTQPAGVVLAGEIDIKSGPGAQYITEFTLHSGAEVSILETRGNWARLALPGGELQGWVSTDTVEAVARE
jgi:tetratricopeptide (TPR) repeat protein